MTHIHNFQRDYSRKHKRPPRFFVKCKCGERAQAVLREGYLHVFSTGRKLEDKDRKRVRTIRLSDVEMQKISDGELCLTVIDNRITIAV